MLKGLDWKDILDRAEWTFAQAFLAAVGAGATITSLSTWKAGALAGAAAVISMLKNTVIQPKQAPAPVPPVPPAAK